MTVRAVLYARVCVDDGQSLVGQLAACREQAHELGWNIVEELAEQGAGSRSSSLPQLDHMLELARAGAFDVLVVRDSYRLSRELAKLLAIEAELKRHGVEIEYILPEHLNTPPPNLVQVVMAGLPAVRRRRRSKGRKEGRER
jgi:DNA invertase Pin-like site-specific DNA recombinase